jgi:tetratricopeptide (TPR) repeat protein
MKRTGWIIVGLMLLEITVGSRRSFAQRNEVPAGYLNSSESALEQLLNRVREGNPTPPLLVQVAETYFDLADELLTDEKKQREAYEAGAKSAKRAFELDESNADAHFLYAVNLGSAVRLKGVADGAMVVNELKHCVQRAIDLNPNHARALHMMGGMLIELPWILGGDEKKAQEYLERAIAADTQYTKAHLLLAKLSMKQGRIADARTHLEAVIHAEHPRYRFAWERKHKPEAERLLNELRHP